MRAEGHAVESICRVLREQGCQIAARTYRAWKRAGRVVAARTVTDAQVVDAVRDIAWTTKVDATACCAQASPEGLYGRRKMTAYLRRTAMPEASAGAVDRRDAHPGAVRGPARQGRPDHDPGQGRDPGR